MIKELNLWATPVTVIDQFVTDNDLINSLKSESVIADTVQGQNTDHLTVSQQRLLHMVSAMVVDYCGKNAIDFNNLKLCNLQKGYLYRYDQQSVHQHLYEPHHDMVEQSFITALFYVDSDYDGVTWCGGELTLYKELTFADYPNNALNILPKSNRLIIFPGFTVHRVKPYFGHRPRTSLVFGWSVIDSPDVPSLTI